jgi:hypothetical protein
VVTEVAIEPRQSSVPSLTATEVRGLRLLSDLSKVEEEVELHQWPDLTPGTDPEETLSVLSVRSS